MITVSNLSYSFPQKDLYNKISFTLEKGNHAAFIGTSGSGKSTLVNIIKNPYDYMYDGELEIDPDCKIGYTRQFYKHDKTKNVTVFDYIAENFLALQDELAGVCTLMETAQDIEPLLEEYQNILNKLEAIDGDNFTININKNLGLAKLTSRKDVLVSELSGGEYKLVQVIKEMLARPDVLIMDEPDVFLDFENINSLRNLINSSKAIILVITHNRYLLNHCFNKIIHLENMELQEFEGRYVDYNFWLTQRKIELLELSQDDNIEIERNDKLIDKLRFLSSEYSDSTKGNTLKARLKVQERLEARRVKDPFVYVNQPAINLVAENVEQDTVAVKVSGYTAAFDEVILDNVNFEIKATDKVAIIGDNGSGKTTLLRDIFKNVTETIEIAPNIDISYLAQDQSETIDEENDIVQELFDFGFKTLDEIVFYLSTFCFKEDTIRQKNSLLSGGERNMLQLAKISSKTSNLLLLDEPTSHLDIYSQIALENAVKEYTGAVIMISHDFYFMINCVDYLLFIEDKTIRKVSMRKFRKMFYANHFDSEYVEKEQNIKKLEMRIALALNDSNFLLATKLSEDLGELIKLL